MNNENNNDIRIGLIIGTIIVVFCLSMAFVSAMYGVECFV